MQEKIGFFKGINLVWTSAIRAIVKVFQGAEIAADALLDVAESAKHGTSYMRKNAEQWEKELVAEWEAEQATKKQLPYVTQ
jgi:hypothetical protein